MVEHAQSHPLRRIIGLSAALATPFTPAGDVDWPFFAAHARNLLSRGMNVVTAFGTMGEGISIPLATRAALYERMAGNGVPPSALVECIYGLAASDAGQQARRAFASGCTGILLTPPSTTSQSARRGSIDGSPRRSQRAVPTPRTLSSTTSRRPHRVASPRAPSRRLWGGIGGVEDSSGEWPYTEALVRAHPDLAILVGNEGHLAAAVRLGASGAISGLANFVPELVGRLVSGVDDARIEPLLRAVLARPVVPAIKAFMADSVDEAWRRVASPLEPLAPARSAGPRAEIQSALAGAAVYGRHR